MEPLEDSVSSRVACKICVAKGDDSAPASSGGCHYCVAKASALNWIKAAGMSADESTKAKRPFSVVKSSYLRKMEEVGVNIVAVKEDDGEGNKFVTVRLPDSYIKNLMSRPPKPLFPLPEDYFENSPDYQEGMGAAAVSVLYTLEREEDILAQFFKHGYAMVEVQVVDS